MTIFIDIIFLWFERALALWPIHMALYYLIRRSRSHSFYKKVRKEASFFEKITYICFWNSLKKSVNLTRLFIILNNYVIISTIVIIPIVVLVLSFAYDSIVKNKILETIYWSSAFIDCSTTIYALRLRDRWLRRNEKE